MKKIVLCICMALMFFVFAVDLKLWYSQSAVSWTEALLIGNSRLGAMVYGGTKRVELQLNEELWGYFALLQQQFERPICSFGHLSVDI